MSSVKSSNTMLIPDLGDIEDVEVIEVLVKVGDIIAIDDAVIVLESAKASMDIPATSAGLIEAIKVRVGDKVNSGDELLRLTTNTSGSTETAETAETAEPDAAKTEGTNESPIERPIEAGKADDAQADSPEADSKEASASDNSNDQAIDFNPSAASSNPDSDTAIADAIYASPAVRRMASEHQIALDNVSGSGPHGRITKADMQTHLQQLGKSEPASSTETTQAKPSNSATEDNNAGANSIALSRIAKLSAAHLQKSWQEIPHVTHFDDADITELEAWRLQLKQQQPKASLSLLPFAMKAVAACLQQHRQFNCRLSEDGQQLLLNQDCHLGIAVNTDAGLLVPVIRNVNNKGLRQLAEELQTTALRAREGKLQGTELEGAGFTISNLGGFGGQHFTPIINAPEVAILGLGQARWKLRRIGPANADGPIEDRLMQPLALSYDHRVINGVEAAIFIQQLKTYLQEMRQLLL